MAKVKITFSGDLSEIGKTRTVTDAEAATMVREGRAVHVPEPAAAQATGSASSSTGTAAPAKP
jgi:hypothetical protein